MIDFTGMIEIGVDTLPEAPGSPSMLFVDEAQDMARRILARKRQNLHSPPKDFRRQ